MRFIRHAVLVVAVAAVSAGSASAQLNGSTTGTGGTGTGTGTGGGTGATTTTAAAPDIAGGDIQALSSTTTATSGVDRSNFLGASYSNPYYQGLFTNATSAPGGFGALTFSTGGGGITGGATGTTGGGTAGRTTTTGGRTTTTTGGANPFGTSSSPFGTTGGQAGRTTTAGGRGGAGGGLGSAATSQFGGQVIPLSRNIAYSAVMRFPTPTITPAQRVADVQAVLTRSTQFSTPAGVTVVQDGAVFVLRGAVGSEDEARLAEGMVRLTPGVREVRNELAFPKQ